MKIRPDFSSGIDESDLDTDNIDVREVDNEARWKVRSATTTGTLSSGATITLTNLIPAESNLFGVTARVTTLITGPTSWLLGVTGDTNQWGDTLALTKGTTVDFSDYTGTKPPEFFAAATSILITRGSASDFTAGVVRVTIFYYTVTAPTS